MKPSDELFKLVKSLTKSEKRFFKLSSTLQSGEKNYIKLFDAIEKQIEYDEEDIKERFKKETFIRHLPSEKNHLYKLILKSLRSYHSDNSITSILQDEIKSVDILFSKALYGECSKIIRKAKKVAVKNERFYYLMQLISREKMLLEEEYHSGNFDRDLNELIAEEEIVMKQLQNLAEYRMLYSKINYVFRKGGYARNDKEKSMVQDILDHPLIKGKNTALSKTAAASCYYIQGLCALVQYKYEDSFEKFSRVVQIFEENPHLIIEIPKHYIRALNNLLFCYLDKNDYDSFFELISKIRKLEDTPGFVSTDIKLKIFSSTYNAELIAYDKMGDYEKAINIVDNILGGIENFGQQISKEEEIIFYYNIAYSYFGVDQWKNALKWINKMLNDNEQHLRQDIFSFSRLFSLIIHFELEHYDLLEYMLKSTNRFYNKRRNEIGREYKVENLFIKYMKKLSKAANNREKSKELLTDLQKEMLSTITEPYEKVALGYFDFLGWIEAKLNNQTFGEYKKSKLVYTSKTPV